MIRNIISCLVLLIIVAPLLPKTALAVPFAQSESGAECQWEYIDRGPYIEDTHILKKFQKHVKFYPDHIRGDADFHGNGPRINAFVRLYVHPTGVFADLDMNAAETKSDWTTVSGNSRKWYYRTMFVLVAVGQGTPDNPHSIVRMNTSSTWKHSYVDNDHEQDLYTFPGEDLISKVAFVGDLQGDEAGARTSIAVHTPITVACIAFGKSGNTNGQSDVKPYASLCIRNKTGSHIPFRYRWGNESEWAYKTIDPYDWEVFYRIYPSYREHKSPRYYIQFNSRNDWADPLDKDYYLLRKAVVTPYCDGSQNYAFNNTGHNSIDLFNN